MVLHGVTQCVVSSGHRNEVTVICCVSAVQLQIKHRKHLKDGTIITANLGMTKGAGMQAGGGGGGAKLFPCSYPPKVQARPPRNQEREKKMFYLTTHSTHFIYGYMASDIWLRIVRKQTRCRHIGYSYRLKARVLLYASSHRQDNTYLGIWCTSRGALAGTRNSSMSPPHEGSIRRPIAPMSYVPLPRKPV